MQRWMGSGRAAVVALQGGMEPVVEIVEVKPGRKVSRRSRTGRVTTVMIDRMWRVDVDGEPVGFVYYEMVTHERRTDGRRYVNDRWDSPGWTHTSMDSTSRFHAATKKEAIATLVRWAADR